MINLSKRSSELELMDLPNPDPFIIRQTIREIEKINLLLGGFNQTLQDLESFKFYKESLSIQDWGCGSGDLLRKISAWSKRKKIPHDLTGLDIDPETIRYAEEISQEYSIRFYCKDIFSPDLEENSTDIVCSCLFSHHFLDEDWIRLIKKMLAVSRIGVIINDLHRHWFAYYSIKLLTRIFAKSYMVRYDAPLSVARGFTKRELLSFLQIAGIKNYKLRWKWAFRWSLVIYKNQ